MARESTTVAENLDWRFGGPFGPPAGGGGGGDCGDQNVGRQEIMDPNDALNSWVKCHVAADGWPDEALMQRAAASSCLVNFQSTLHSERRGRRQPRTEEVQAVFRETLDDLWMLLGKHRRKRRAPSFSSSARNVRHRDVGGGVVGGCGGGVGSSGGGRSGGGGIGGGGLDGLVERAAAHAEASRSFQWSSSNLGMRPAKDPYIRASVHEAVEGGGNPNPGFAGGSDASRRTAYSCPQFGGGSFRDSAVANGCALKSGGRLPSDGPHSLPAMLPAQRDSRAVLALEEERMSCSGGELNPSVIVSGGQMREAGGSPPAQERGGDLNVSSNGGGTRYVGYGERAISDPQCGAREGQPATAPPLPLPHPGPSSGESGARAGGRYAAEAGLPQGTGLSTSQAPGRALSPQRWEETKHDRGASAAPSWHESGRASHGVRQQREGERREGDRRAGEQRVWEGDEREWRGGEPVPVQDRNWRPSHYQHERGPWSAEESRFSSRVSQLDAPHSGQYNRLPSRDERAERGGVWSPVHAGGHGWQDAPHVQPQPLHMSRTAQEPGRDDVGYGSRDVRRVAEGPSPCWKPLASAVDGRAGPCAVGGVEEQRFGQLRSRREGDFGRERWERERSEREQEEWQQREWEWQERERRGLERQARDCDSHRGHEQQQGRQQLQSGNPYERERWKQECIEQQHWKERQQQQQQQQQQQRRQQHVQWREQWEKDEVFGARDGQLQHGNSQQVRSGMEQDLLRERDLQLPYARAQQLQLDRGRQLQFQQQQQHHHHQQQEQQQQQRQQQQQQEEEEEKEQRQQSGYQDVQQDPDHARAMLDTLGNSLPNIVEKLLRGPEGDRAALFEQAVSHFKKQLLESVARVRSSPDSGGGGATCRAAGSGGRDGGALPLNDGTEVDFARGGGPVGRFNGSGGVLADRVQPSSPPPRHEGRSSPPSKDVHGLSSSAPGAAWLQAQPFVRQEQTHLQVQGQLQRHDQHGHRQGHSDERTQKQQAEALSGGEDAQKPVLPWTPLGGCVETRGTAQSSQSPCAPSATVAPVHSGLPHPNVSSGLNYGSKGRQDGTAGDCSRFAPSVLFKAQAEIATVKPSSTPSPSPAPHWLVAEERAPLQPFHNTPSPMRPSGGGFSSAPATSPFVGSVALAAPSVCGLPSSTARTSSVSEWGPASSSAMPSQAAPAGSAATRPAAAVAAESDAAVGTPAVPSAAMWYVARRPPMPWSLSAHQSSVAGSSVPEAGFEPLKGVAQTGPHPGGSEAVLPCSSVGGASTKPLLKGGSRSSTSMSSGTSCITELALFPSSASAADPVFTNGQGM